MVRHWGSVSRFLMVEKSCRFGDRIWRWEILWGCDNDAAVMCLWGFSPSCFSSFIVVKYTQHKIHHLSIFFFHLGHFFVCACSVPQSCSTLNNPMDCSPPGSSVLGISQARILEWIAISFSRGSSQSKDRVCVPTGRQILYHCATWVAILKGY